MQGSQRRAQLAQVERSVNAAMQPLGDPSLSDLAQLSGKLISRSGKDAASKQNSAGEGGQRRAQVLLSSVAILDLENSFGEGRKGGGALELALWIGPEILAENLDIGIPENPIWVVQDAAKAHRPMDEVIALGEASLQPVGGVGDEIHFAGKPTQVRAGSDEMEVQIADRGSMSTGRGTG